MVGEICFVVLEIVGTVIAIGLGVGVLFLLYEMITSR